MSILQIKTMQEIWKKIPEFSRYEISNLGNIRSLNYMDRGIVKNLKPALDKGYMKTMIKNDNGKYKTIAIHRIVASVFLGKKPTKKHEVNHINGAKNDNRLCNLEYMTRKENVRHAYTNNLVGSKKGSKNNQSILTEQQVIEIREHAKKHGRYYGNKELAKKYGVSRDLIQRIVNRRMWTHV
jgi:hypothetical protein